MKQNNPYLLSIFFLILFPAIFFAQPVSPVHAQNSFDWTGEWIITLTSGDQTATTEITVTRNSNGNLTAALGDLFYSIKKNPPAGYPKQSSTTSVTENVSEIIIRLDNYHTGSPTFNAPVAKIKTSTCTIKLSQTSDPNRITGEETCLITHFVTGNEQGWYVVEQPKPFNPGLIQIEGVRVGGSDQSQPPPAQLPGNTLEKATFSISMGCIDRIQISENIDCSVTITPDNALSGTAFSVIWLVDGVMSGENGGSITRDSISVPVRSAGSHQVTVNVTSIATGNTLSASSTTLVEAPGAVVPVPQEPADQSQPEENPVAPRPSADSTVDFTGAGNRVNALGQSAATAATFLFVLAWLLLEGQPPPASTTSSLADTIIDESGTAGEQEAGEWLAGNTSAILDNLNKPPARPPSPQAPTVQPIQAPQPSETSTTQSGNKPGAPFTGSITNVRLEVLSDQDAYLVMQAMGLVPTELTETDHRMDVTREDLDHLLGGHPDGNPHWVRLPNGNEFLACNVRGLAFEDLYNAQGSETNTIDFQSHFSISVYIADPDTSVSPPAPAAHTGGTTGTTATPPPVPASEDIAAVDSTRDDSFPQAVSETDQDLQEEATSVWQPDASDSVSPESSDQTAAQSSSGSTASTRNAISEEEELDSFVDAMEPVGGEESSPGEFAGGTEPESLEYESPESQTGQSDVSTGENYTRDLNRRIDNLIDDLKNTRTEPPTTSDATGGEGGGSSTAGIIDGDDNTSATGGF